MALKTILIIAGATVVVLGGAGGAIVALGIFPHHSATAAAAAPPPPKPLLFAQLSDVMASIPDDAGDPPSSYVEFAVQFSTTDPNALTIFTSLQPIIKSDVISLLMSQTSKTLQDPAVRATLAKNCLAISNGVLTHNGNYVTGNPFTAAYITNLVVQN